MAADKPVQIAVRALRDIPGAFAVWGCAETHDGIKKDTTYTLTVREGVDPAAVEKSATSGGIFEVVKQPPQAADKAGNGKP